MGETTLFGRGFLAAVRNNDFAPGSLSCAPARDVGV